MFSELRPISRALLTIEMIAMLPVVGIWLLLLGDAGINEPPPAEAAVWAGVGLCLVGLGAGGAFFAGGLVLGLPRRLLGWVPYVTAAAALPYLSVTLLFCLFTLDELFLCDFPAYTPTGPPAKSLLDCPDGSLYRCDDPRACAGELGVTTCEGDALLGHRGMPPFGCKSCRLVERGDGWSDVCN